MTELYKTIATAMRDAAQEGCLDLSDPAERRRAVRWGLSIVAQYDPDTLRAAMPGFKQMLDLHDGTDWRQAERAIEEITLEQITGSVLRMN